MHFETFKKRFVITGVRRGQLTFVLETNPSRLYFDQGAQRIELGSGLSEPEREWLFKQLEPWGAR